MMASSLRIIDLNGRVLSIVKGSGQKWSEVIAKANLPKRFDYCVRHWMADDPNDTATEERIKAYLDRVGYILIQDDPDGRIITDYKAMRDKIALIPVSGIPQLENVLYSRGEEFGGSAEYVPERSSESGMTKVEEKVYAALTKPKRIPPYIKRIQEKRKRVEDALKAHPDATVTYCTVDTHNEFTYNGNRKKISDAIKQYQPKRVRGEELYDMDYVVCLSNKDGVFYYDQDFFDITEGVA